jgi:AhpD family alkylhydroperoxidase
MNSCRKRSSRRSVTKGSGVFFEARHKESEQDEESRGECAVAFTTQCPYCIELHANKAREVDASDPEIAEAVLVAAALRAGGAITHGTHAMK